MAEESVVLTDITSGVATITINRPGKLNALNAAVRSEFVATLAKLEENADVRVAIVTGAGEKSFVAGSDISEFAGRSAVEQFRVMRKHGIYSAAEAFAKPLIAAINGFCLGGGCELALACDIRIASERAKFGQPEINLGILPGGGGTQRLARLVGLGHTFKLVLSGEMIGASEALRIGLVEEVVPPERLMDRARELAGAIAKKSPVALQLIKEAIRASVRTPLDEGLRLESTLLSLAFSSADKEEGVRAFLEKREAKFEGK